MLSLLSRGCLSALIVFQALQPAVAWTWYVIEEPCCWAAEWECCEGDILVSDPCGCEAEPVMVGDCGCGSEVNKLEVAEPSKEPEPAPSQKPETASPETPQPALDPSEELPPAPINVPETPPAGEAQPTELFPGPAAESAPPADTEPLPSTPTRPAPTDVVPPADTATEPSAQPSNGAGEVFEEPAAEPAPTTPAAEPEAPASESEATESSSFDDLFGEPAPSGEASGDTPAVEEETIEVESSESDAPEGESTEQPAADPLDDLFGPTSAVERHRFDSEVRATLGTPAESTIGKVREWSNRGADVLCEGRLIKVTAEGVFVAQYSGAVVAIAFSELSDGDLAFVRNYVRTQLAQQDFNSQIAAQNLR